MGGNLTMGSVGSVGLGWGRMKRKAIGLVSYSAVSRLQHMLNVLVDATRGLSGSCDIQTMYKTAEDGKWGDETQALFMRVVQWSADGCNVGYGVRRPGQAVSAIRTFGPRYFSDVLKSGSLGFVASDSDINTYVRAFYGYMESKSGRPEEGDMVPGPTPGVTPAPSDPDAAARAACTASGGTWDPVGKVCLPATYGDTGEGMGTGTWILLFIIGALAAGGIYYVATD